MLAWCDLDRLSWITLVSGLNSEFNKHWWASISSASDSCACSDYWEFFLPFDYQVMLLFFVFSLIFLPVFLVFHHLFNTLSYSCISLAFFDNCMYSYAEIMLVTGFSTQSLFNSKYLSRPLVVVLYVSSSWVIPLPLSALSRDNRSASALEPCILYRVRSFLALLLCFLF